MTAQGVGAQRRPNPRVRTDHRHWDPGPVSNMPTCRCEHPNRHRLGILKQARQVADHSTRSFGQSPQDRLVQILRDNIIEPAGNLKDGYLTYRVLSGPYLPTSGRPGG